MRWKRKATPTLPDAGEGNKMIQPQEYLQDDGGMKYVTEEMVASSHPLSLKPLFDEFFSGQTCPCVKDGKNAVYAHDYENWLQWLHGR